MDSGSSTNPGVRFKRKGGPKRTQVASSLPTKPRNMLAERSDRGTEDLLLGLTPHQACFIEAMVLAGTVKRALEHNIWKERGLETPHETTIYRWMRNPKILAPITHTLTRMAIPGALVGQHYLIQVVSDRNVDDSDRIKAASKLLDYASQIMGMGFKHEETKTIGELVKSQSELLASISNLVEGLGPTAKRFLAEHTDKKIINVSDEDDEGA